MAEQKRPPIDKHELGFAMLPLLGSIIFIPGSVLFLPPYSDQINQGCYCFLVGLVLFLIGGLPHVFTINDHKHMRCLNLLAEVMMYSSTIVYFVGVIFFMDEEWLPDNAVHIGSWLFIGGSILLGAALLCKDVVHAKMISKMKWYVSLLMTWASAFGFIGAFLWGGSSALYIFDLTENAVYAFTAYSYIAGSVFLTLSSIINVVFVVYLKDVHDETAPIVNNKSKKLNWGRSAIRNFYSTNYSTNSSTEMEITRAKSEETTELNA